MMMSAKPDPDYLGQIALLTQRVEMLEAHCKLISERIIKQTKDYNVIEQPPPSSCPTSELVKFTAKQHATMQMLALGKSNKYIADMLKVTESTAKVHVRSVMQKKKATNRQEVMATYKITLAKCSPEEYLMYAGIPKDWAIHPENYPTHTNKLRESYHVKTGKTS